MNRKVIFIQGIILITITMLANVVLTNWFLSKRIVDYTNVQNSVIRSVDHIFTALTYMERNTNAEFNDKIKHELESARESLRTPELMTIRRRVEK